MNNELARINMINQQLRTGDVLQQTILDLYKKVPREAFIPPPFSPFAFSDMQIDLPNEQRMLTPLEEGKILQVMNFKGHETVLEIGTGTGFFTALLSCLCKNVISVDYYERFTLDARRKLNELSYNNVELYTGNAYNGWLDKAPYHAVIFTGAIEAITETHRLQVLPGGQLFAIIGIEPVMQGQLHRLDHQGQWTMEVIFETNIPPLLSPIKQNYFVF
jgi:protein-L-isoaspartate(D-aspartate) O-methyltransferase